MFSCLADGLLSLLASVRNMFLHEEHWVEAEAVWIHAGEVMGRRNLVLEPSLHDHPAATFPQGPGWKILEHGDRLNSMALQQDGRALYVQGSEVGTGMGVTCCDVGRKPELLEYVYTDGLSGCMALSIIGNRKGTDLQDLFFCHSRRWSDYGCKPASIPRDDPLFAAQSFVRTHDNLNVFYSSGQHAVGSDVGTHWHSSLEEEASILSSILGVWVQQDWYHCLPQHDCLAFSFEHQAWIPLVGGDFKVRAFSSREQVLAALYVTRPWQPDMEVVQQIAKLKQQGSLQLLDAYGAGDFDTVRAIHAAHQRARWEGKRSRLDEAVEACYSSMVSRGLGRRYDARERVEANMQLGRCWVQASSNPNQHVED